MQSKSLARAIHSSCLLSTNPLYQIVSDGLSHSMTNISKGLFLPSSFITLTTFQNEPRVNVYLSLSHLPLWTFCRECNVIIIVIIWVISIAFLPKEIVYFPLLFALLAYLISLALFYLNYTAFVFRRTFVDALPHVKTKLGANGSLPASPTIFLSPFNAASLAGMGIWGVAQAAIVS